MIGRFGKLLLRLIVVFLALIAVRPVANDLRDRLQFSMLTQRYECGGFGEPCSLSERRYSALIPKGDGPFPAVIFFPGSGGDGQGTIRNRPLVQPMLERGYAVISPTALVIDYRSGPGTGWVWDKASYGWDDYEFTAQLLGDMAERFPIDPARILVSGHSRGGSFAWYLACADVDPRLKSFAPIGGTLQWNKPGSCVTSKFDFDMFYSHGYADTIIPFSTTVSAETEPFYTGAIESAYELAFLAKCEADELIRNEAYDPRTWTQCANGNSVSLLGFRGGHGIPKGWADKILDWFEGLPEY